MTASRVRTLLLVVALGLSALVACSGSRAHFSHEYHLTRIACGGPGQPRCLNCTSCHKVDKTNHMLPRVTACRNCHKPAEQTTLAAVHPAPNDDLQFAESLRFSHEQHLKMPALSGQCVPCHAGVVPPADDPQASVFPPMKRCFKCHEHQQQWDQAKCTRVPRAEGDVAGDAAELPPPQPGLDAASRDDGAREAPDLLAVP